MVSDNQPLYDGQIMKGVQRVLVESRRRVGTGGCDWPTRLDATVMQVVIDKSFKSPPCCLGHHTPQPSSTRLYSLDIYGHQRKLLLFGQ
jgi:hypothetical protein